jgi:hypothetical protein
MNYCSNFAEDVANKIVKKVYCQCCIDMCKKCKGPNDFNHTKKEVRNMFFKLIDFVGIPMQDSVLQDVEFDELISFALCYFHEYDLEKFLDICYYIHLRNYKIFFQLREVLIGHVDCVDLEKFSSLNYDTNFDDWNFKSHTHGAKMSFKAWVSLFLDKYEKIRFVEVIDIGNGFYKDSFDFVLSTENEKIIVHHKLLQGGKKAELKEHEKYIAKNLGYSFK